MAKAGMRRITVFSFVAAVITGILCRYFDRDIYLTLAITFGKITYHLGMRLRRRCVRRSWCMKRIWRLVFCRLLRSDGLGVLCISHNVGLRRPV